MASNLATILRFFKRHLLPCEARELVQIELDRERGTGEPRSEGDFADRTIALAAPAFEDAEPGVFMGTEGGLWPNSLRLELPCKSSAA
jgi:hypothetical protein